MLGEDDNASEYFGSHKDEKYTLDKQDIKRNDKDLVGQSLDTRSRVRNGLSGDIPQAGLFVSEL